MIITIKTDQPDAQIALYNAEGQEIEEHNWYAHRELSNTLLTELRDLLARHGKAFKDLTGVVVFQGPGSFTGLRIGISVANALAYGLTKPIVGVRQLAEGEAWQADGIAKIHAGNNDKIVMPHYGAEAHITPPRK